MLDDIIDEVAILVKENPHLRYGQALFNVMWEHPPTKKWINENQVLGSPIDPYYDDNNIIDFLYLALLSGCLKQFK